MSATCPYCSHGMLHDGSCPDAKLHEDGPTRHAKSSRKQPPPRPGGVAVWPALLASGLVPPSLREACEARDALGRSRYGRPLEPGNGRDAARDCLEELLDAIAYSGQHAMEAAPGAFDSEEWECVRQVVQLASRVQRMMEARGK